MNSRVIMLPCAGGSAANYSKYKLYLNDCVAYEYPGHWSKWDHPLSHSLDDTVDELFEYVVNTGIDNPALFGHSMGGIIAWELSKKLLLRGHTVNGLYIAGCVPPEIHPAFLSNIKNDNDIKTLLSSIRQVPHTVLKSKFFNEDLLPAIRNDFRMINEYLKDYSDDRMCSIPVPLTCLCGLDDPVVSREDMLKWERYTSKAFECRDFPGDHFFVYRHENLRKSAEMILMCGR